MAERRLVPKPSFVGNEFVTRLMATNEQIVMKQGIGTVGQKYSEEESGEYAPQYPSSREKPNYRNDDGSGNEA
ncbi:hypothetical protein Mal33_50470 [Rosistilla oblonga]|uniref:Uncharacterized protein n=1 Tax=Rosistilla oblonga TaxID=2527990 RepID=A0A518J116_9BACT|nr:hypothetical protein Mal33_50470 [Rosistilla oblonga]